MPDQLGRVLDALISCLDNDIDAHTLADALWLAAASSIPNGVTMEANEPSSAVNMSERQAIDRPRTERKSSNSAVQSHHVSVQVGAPADAYQLYEDLKDTPTSLSGPSVSVPAGRSLSQTVELGRSLRPFMRRYPHGRRTGLDMQATIDSYASGGELVPVLAPLPEPWFDVVVVTDTHLTTEVWRGAIEEFISLLQNTGAFRHVRRWRLSTDGNDPYVTDSRGHFVNVVSSAGSENRRLFLIMSDCTAPAWYESKVWQLLRQWAARAPLSIASPLPSRLWHRTALDLPAVHVRNRTPGGSNAELRVSTPPHLQWVMKQGEPYMAIPTLTLTAHSLQRWAYGFVRGAPEGYEAVMVGPYGNAPSPFLSYVQPSAEVGSAEAAVKAAQAFMHMASPAAVRLAALSCSFGRLTLPLLQLIRQEVVRDANNDDIAELLTSSLLSVDTANQGPPLITFTNQARDQLSTVASRHDAWQTYETLSRYIAQRTRLPSKSLDAVAALSADQLPEDLQPFAYASQDLLKALRKGSAALGVAYPGTGSARAGEQQTYQKLVRGEGAASDAQSLDDPRVEQVLGHLYSDLWDNTALDDFSTHDRQAADQVLKAFVYFLAECLSSQVEEPRFSELESFISTLAQKASHYGVVVETGTDNSFMLRAYTPGLTDGATVLGEVFTFGTQWHRPQETLGSSYGSRSDPRIAPFSILITFTGRGRSNQDLLASSISVAQGLTTKVIALRFPL
ncbi:SAV_2336 N-terminal domain-related protein [Streptomyces sp. NPDC059441]|uniref:SAV_2336 N-terminal domain-related protein n=1 Tax=Streptomyces sp. NPDC059441 TaxID=3346829 RepID=UPI0036A3ACF0